MKWKDKWRIGDVIEKNMGKITTEFLNHYPLPTLYIILYKAFRSTKAHYSPEYMLVKNIRGKEEKIRLTVGDYLILIFFCDSGKDVILRT